MHNSTKILSVLILALALGACQTRTERPAALTGKARTEIATARTAFLGAYKARSAAKLSALYTEDAYFAGVVTPRWMAGRRSIQGAWTAFFRRFRRAEIKFNPIDLRGTDTLAAETGCLFMLMTDRKSRRRITNLARYTLVRVKVGNQWLIQSLHVSEPSGRARLRAITRSSCQR